MEEKKSFFNRLKEKLSVKKVLAVVLVLAVVGFGVSRFLPRPGGTRPTFQTNGTRTTTLTRQVLNDSVTATGTVESTQTVNVTSTVTGYTVKEIMVQAGDYVQEGDVIATLDTTDLLENITKVKEKLVSNQETAQLNYNQAETDMNNAYDACIAQETVLNSATQVRDTAYRNFEIAKTAVALQQSEYDAAAAAAQSANNTNNQYIAVMNDKKVAMDTAASAMATAQASLAAAQADYDTAMAENSEDTESLKAMLDSAQAEYAGAETAYNTAKNEYQSAADTVTATQADYDNAKAAVDAALNALNDAKVQANYNSLENEYNTAEKNQTVSQNNSGQSAENIYKCKNKF